MDAASIAGANDGKGCRFHLIFLPLETLCHDNENTGSAHISVSSFLPSTEHSHERKIRPATKMKQK